MLGSREYTFEDKLKVWITGDREDRRSVYFTDQFPVFDVSVQNLTDRPLELDLRITFADQRRPHEQHDYEQFVFDINPNSTETTQFEPDMLAYQGSAVLGIASPEYGDVSKAENGGATIRPWSGFQELTPLYTFMVYDREFYKVNYFRTRWVQYVSALLAVLIIGIGVLQLL